MSLGDGLARRRVGPTGTTPTALTLHVALAIIGAFAFRPTIPDGFETRVLLVGLIVSLALLPPALLLDARRVAADTGWTPRRWLYLVLGLVPNPIGFLALGDYLRKRRVALRDGGADLDEPIARQLLRIFAPALGAVFALGVLADATAFPTSPATARYGVVAAVEAAFYMAYVWRA